MSNNNASSRVDQLRLVLDVFRGSPAQVEVSLENRSSAPLPIFHAGNPWGDKALSFRGKRGQAAAVVHRRLEHPTVQEPAKLVVPAGESHRWHIDFGDGAWLTDVTFDEWIGAGATLIAIFAIESTEESRQLGIWEGHLESTPALWQP